MSTRSLPLRGTLTFAALAVLLSGCTLPGGNRTPGAVATPAPATSSATVTPPAPPAPQTPAEPSVGPSSETLPTRTVGMTPSDSPTSLLPPPWTPSASATAASPTPPPPPLQTPPTAAPGLPGTAITVVPGELRHLAKENASQAMLWVEGPAQPASGGGWIYALGTTVACQATSAPLEFRFARTAGTLSLSVAQAADSRSSGERLDWSVLVDGRAALSRSVGFTEIAELTVPLAGVSSVQILVTHPGPCQGLATGLITRAVVTG